MKVEHKLQLYRTEEMDIWVPC